MGAGVDAGVGCSVDGIDPAVTSVRAWCEKLHADRLSRRELRHDLPELSEYQTKLVAAYEALEQHATALTIAMGMEGLRATG